MKKIVRGGVVCVVLALGRAAPASAASNIESGSTYLSSNLGGSVNPDFKGGTLQIDGNSTITQNFNVEDDDTNTIDADGHVATMSGNFTGAGPLTFSDSVGGGNVILTNSGNSYTGQTTINAGATLSLSGTGTLVDSSGIADGGTFDISQTTAGASITTLTGTGTVNLGAQTLTLTTAAGTFSGTIAGTGGLILTSGTENLGGANTYSGGTTITAGTLVIGAGAAAGSIAGNVANTGILEFERSDVAAFGGIVSGTGGVTQAGSGTITLTGVNTYTGATTVTAGTLALSPSGSIASSSGVTDDATFDISGTTGASIKSLSGTGIVNLGNQALTISAGAGAFSGVINGTGSLVVSGGTELLTGASTYTGSTIVTGGMLEVGAPTVGYNVTVQGSGAFAFDSAAPIAMTGVVSGSGGVSQVGNGITTITTVQTYTGATTVSAGTLALAAGGSIAASSTVNVTAGTFDISASPGGASIISLSGSGTVQLGAQALTLTNASGSFAGNITGTGGVTLAGGTLTLTGGNTYTGATTIASGTLVLAGTSTLSASSRIVDNAALDISTVTNGGLAPSTSIVSLAGNGTVFLGTRTLVLTNAGDSFAGTISGTGGITVSGGTQTLTGANSYTGVTTITAGTLALAGGGSLYGGSNVADNGILDISASGGGTVSLGSLSGTGTVTLGGHTLNLVAGAGNFSGVIAGTGGLIVSGGTQILSGANSYSGGTVISGGTLQIGNYDSFGGSIAGDVVDNAALVFYRPNSGVFAGAISGTGTVSQTGSGTIILTGANSYGGGTSIAAGTTLQIGNGAASGAIAGNVADNGTLAFGRSDTTTFGGTISGSGGVSQLSGTTMLTAVNSYGGATAINAGGDLALVGAGSVANSSGVADDGAFDVSAAAAPPRIASLSGSGTVNLGAQSLTLTNASGTFSGAISGSGGLTIAAGTETLTGANNYTGMTTVASGATLAGVGTISSVTVNNGGTLAPGVAGAGTLAVNGTVAFNSGSTYLVNLSSAGASKLVTTGAETLAGTLSLASADGGYPLGQKLTVLTADDGLTGTFTLAPLPASGADYTSALSYDADNVYLEIELARLSPLLPTGATRDQASPIGGIDAAIAAGDSLPASFQNLGDLPAASLASDAGQLAGEVAADASQAGRDLSDPFMDAIFDHIEDRTASRRRTEVWASGFADSSVVFGDPATDGSHKLGANATGFIGGADFALSPTLMLGGALSVGTARFHVADGLGTGKTDGFQAAAYGLAQLTPRLYGSFAGLVSLDDFTTHRMLTVSGSDDLEGKFKATAFSGRFETGVRLGWVTPYVALDDTLFSAPAYGETAASGASTFALRYDGQTSNSAGLEVGARQRANIPLSRDWSLSLSDRVGWGHEFSVDTDAQAAFIALPDSGFTAYGASPDRDRLLISLGAALKDRYGLDLNLHFESAASSNSQSYAGLAGLNITW